MKSLVVAIVTRKDSNHLRDLVLDISRQTVLGSWSQPEICVVVNDEREKTENLDAWFKADPHIRGRGVVLSEARKGIPPARNKALEWALVRGHDWLVFIDDDCSPEPDWLNNLVACASRGHAGVIAGSWRLEPSGLPSPYIPNATWERGSYPPWLFENSTVSTLTAAYTRNVLLKLADLNIETQEPVRFSESLPHQGGSDVRFFRQLHRAGVRIHYCDSAVVREFYGGERLTLRWHLKRRIRNTQLIMDRGDWSQILRALFSLRFCREKFSSTVQGALSVKSPRRISDVRELIGSLALGMATILGAVTRFVGLRYLSYSDRWVWTIQGASD